LSSEKIVGILGGMGPEATADLFMKIIKSTPASRDQEHLRVVIDSNSKIPDRTQFLLGKGIDPRDELIKTAKNVERMGADVLGIPCNTAHYFYDDIRRAVSIPVLHIMEEVARTLEGKIQRVGLLASTGTVRTHLYDTHLSSVDIETIVPNDGDQKKVMDAIYKVKGGELSLAREIALVESKKLVERGAQAIIAGCTEIPLILRDGDLKVPVIDATLVLARALVATAKK
jgi:aspartate racemase